MTANPSSKRRKNQSPYDDDLFSASTSATENRPPKEPLADRMRPRRFEDFVGQAHIVGEGKLLRRAIEADRLTSILLWGPPGTGKTTLANIIAHETKAHFVTLNAVLDGIKELREVVEAAEARPRNQRTVLFIDEIHRWNKAQQDSLLPHIESGTITLVGATTENPFFSLVNPLISRSRVFRLETLPPEGVRAVILRAVTDPDQGLGRMNLNITEEALHHWVDIAHGDARSALNALELAALTTPPRADGVIHIDLDIAAESIQRRAVLYDRDQDEHYDTISAFIKSMRGSDPDGALYWMAKMLHAGEDPRFLFRRMLILCSEDIGLADPNAIVVVNSLAEAFERVGMPEGNYFLSHACLYCATAPKSNTASAIFKAIKHIEEAGTAPVPLHLRDSTSNAAQARHDGRESPSDAYKYPHLYPGAWVEQQYLPQGMTPPHWYSPKRLGYEGKVYQRFAERGQISDDHE